MGVQPVRGRLFSYDAELGSASFNGRENVENHLPVWLRERKGIVVDERGNKVKETTSKVMMGRSAQEDIPEDPTKDSRSPDGRRI